MSGEFDSVSAGLMRAREHTSKFWNAPLAPRPRGRAPSTWSVTNLSLSGTICYELVQPHPKKRRTPAKTVELRPIILLHQLDEGLQLLLVLVAATSTASDSVHGLPPSYIRS